MRLVPEPLPAGADAGDVPAHTIGLGYDEAAISAAEAAEEQAPLEAADPGGRT